MSVTTGIHLEDSTMTDEHEPDGGLAAALFEVARVRYTAFYERFGRDPEPHEPLLFDPREDDPTPATIAERRSQIAEAAQAANVDASAILRLLGLGWMQ
jgi:hypothetical protein